MKYILSVLGMIVFGIIAVILFARSADNGQNTQVGKQAVKVSDHINNQSKVEYTKYGSLVADEQRRTLRITVTENERTIEILKGYNEMVETRKTYPNNQDSYNVFMRSLDVAGFTREKKSKISDPVGACPSGYRFEYKLKQLNEDVSSLWNNSCQTMEGTLANSGAAIRTIFEKQIPDFKDVLRGVKF